LRRKAEQFATGQYPEEAKFWYNGKKIGAGQASGAGEPGGNLTSPPPATGCRHPAGAGKDKEPGIAVRCRRDRNPRGGNPAPATAPARRLKVLQLLTTMPVGGAEDLVAAIVRGLNPERFAPAVATLGPPGPVGQELRAQGYEVISLGLDIKRTSTWRVVGAVRHLLQAERPDILHTHLYHPNLYGRLGALGLGLPGVVAAVHNAYTRVKFHRRVWNFLLAWATDLILVGSPQVWQDVRRYDGVPASRLLLLPYGIPMAELDTHLSRAAARKRVAVSSLVLGAVGRLEEQKGHAYLLAALPEVRRQVPDLTLLLVGEGRRQADLDRQVRDLGLAGTVRFLGTRRDLPEIFRALDMFVHPSLWEGLPLALLKAMGAGLPVVATRVSGCMEAIKDGVNGRLVAPGDSGGLAQAILELARQPEERRRLGDAARRTVAEKYSLEAMLKRLEELYLELGERAGLAG
jgi:glycosyltransferase involved in cell wall biosynthesis